MLQRQISILLVFLLLFFAIQYATDYTECTVLSTSGSHALTTTDVSPGPGRESCINISASNIVLNLGGRTISHSNASTAAAIKISGFYENITIANGTINNSYYGVYAINTDNITITNVSFTNFTNSGENYAIYFENVTNSTLANLTIAVSNSSADSMDIGIFLRSGSNRIIIANSTIYDNHRAVQIDNGVYWISIFNNTVNRTDMGFSIEGYNITMVDNNISYSYYGIVLGGVANNTLKNTNLSYNYYGFSLDGDYYEYASQHNIGTTNMVDNKSLYYVGGAACSTDPVTINGASNYAAVYLMNCTPSSENFVIENATFNYAGEAIFVFGNTFDSTSLTIRNVTINDSYYGVYINNFTDASSSRTVINISSSSFGSPHADGSVGIQLAQIFNPFVRTEIFHNTIKSFQYGILISTSTNLTDITNNTLYNNSLMGVYLSTASNVSLVGNTINYSAPAAKTATINGRPTDYRYRSTATAPSITIGTEADGSYTNPFGLYSYISVGIVINNTDISGAKIGYVLDLTQNVSMSNLFVTNVSEGIYLKHSQNISLSSVSTSQITNTITGAAGSKYIDLRLRNSTANVTLTSVSINGTVIDCNLTYTNYTGTGGIIFDAAPLPLTASGYGSSMGKLVNISMLETGLTGAENKSFPINFTMHYDPSGFQTNTIKGFEWNGTSWTDLTPNATLDTDNNNITFKLFGTQSIFGLFAALTPTPTPTPTPNPPIIDMLGASAEVGCANIMGTVPKGIITVTISVPSSDTLSGAGIELYYNDVIIGSESTDSTGRATFSDLQNGNYKIIASKSGYFDTTKTISVSCPNCPNAIVNSITLPIENTVWDQDNCEWVCQPGYVFSTTTGGCEELEWVCQPGYVFSTTTGNCEKSSEDEDEDKEGDQQGGQQGGEQTTACISDGDCAGGKCTFGFCVAEGKCGYFLNYNWIPYECCEDKDCDSAFMKCTEHVCTMKKYELQVPPNATVGDTVSMLALEDGTPLINSDIVIKLPNGATKNVKTNDKGEAIVFIDYGGKYTMSLIDEENILDTKSLLSVANPNEGKDKEKQPAIWEQETPRNALILIILAVVLFGAYLYLRGRSGGKPWQEYKKE